MSGTETFTERMQFLVPITTMDEEAIIASLDTLVKDFGVDEVQRYPVQFREHKDSLMHEFVRLGLLKTIEYAASELGFNINVQRESDGNTPIHLAYYYSKSNICELLKKLQANMSIVNKYGESVSDLEQIKESMRNIIWLDTGEIYQYSVAMLSFWLRQMIHENVTKKVSF